jgi:hypothetical protein
MLLETVNPLNVFGMRRVQKVCPPHFISVCSSSDGMTALKLRHIENWIYENLQGRFHVSILALDGVYSFSFESAEDATFFALHLQDIVTQS